MRCLVYWSSQRTAMATAAITSALTRPMLNFRLRNKTVKPSCDVEKCVVDQDETDRNEKRTRGELDRAKVTAQPRQCGKHGADGGGSNEKRQGEAERIERQESRSLRSVLLRSHREDSAENRTDARRPSGGKGHADDQRRPERPPVVLQVRALVHHEKRDANEAHHLQTEDDDQHAADLGNERPVRVERAADGACRQAQNNEDDAESENESNRVRQRFRARSGGRFTLQILQTFAGEQRQVRRHQWEDARRNEGNQARQEGKACRKMHCRA